MYSAGDLWEQMLEKEKEKVKKLEERYAEKMKEKGVCFYFFSLRIYMKIVNFLFTSRFKYSKP